MAATEPEAKFNKALEFVRAFIDQDKPVAQEPLPDRLADIYRKIFPTEEHAWQLIHRIVKDQGVVDEFAREEQAEALAVAVWHLFTDQYASEPDAPDPQQLVRRLETCLQLIDRTDWPQTDPATQVRRGTLDLTFRRLLLGWLASDGSLQEEMQQGMARLLRRGPGLLWRENSPWYFPFLNAQFSGHSRSLLDSALARGQTREQALLHQADCLGRLLEVMSSNIALRPAAKGLCTLTMPVIQRWRSDQEPVMARLDQGETGLLTAIEAISRW